ncbi:MAG: hypothetical protein ACR2HP_12055 [Ilumatobacteraceae bacterium]
MDVDDERALVVRDDGSTALSEDDAPAPTRRRRLNRELAVISLLIAAGFVFIVIGLLRSVSGDEVTDLPDAVEEIAPTPDAAQVLQQTDVFVDLAEGYEGELTVDGVVLPTVRLDQIEVEPGEQAAVPAGTVRFEPGNGTLTFRPSEGTAIDSFDPGQHNVIVTYWRTDEGRGAARSYSWTFAVI